MKQLSRLLHFGVLTTACASSVGNIERDASLTDVAIDQAHVKADRTELRDVLNQDRNDDVKLYPAISLFTTARGAGIGSNRVVGVYAQVMRGNEPLTDQTVRLSTATGNGEFDSITNGGYSSDQSTSIIMMDHVCLDLSGSYVRQGNGLIRASGSFGRIVVQPSLCRGVYVDTGFLVSRLYVNNTTNRIRATALSLPEYPETHTDVTVSQMPSVAETTFIATPITDHARVDQTFAIMITAMNNDHPISCDIPGIPASTNGESNEESGCNVMMNGPERDWPHARAGQNRSNYSQAWSIMVNESASSNLLFVARGRGTEERSQNRILTNLGGGMYIAIVRAARAGQAYFSTQLHSNSVDSFGSIAIAIE